MTLFLFFLPEGWQDESVGLSRQLLGIGAMVGGVGQDDTAFLARIYKGT